MSVRYLSPYGLPNAVTRRTLARRKIFRRSVLQTQPPKRGFGFNAARAWDLGYPCAIFLRLSAKIYSPLLIVAVLIVAVPSVFPTAAGPPMSFTY